MKNITELRDELTAVFKGLKDGTISPKQAQEMNNAADKITATLKVQLEYAAMRKEVPSIEFLGDRA